MKGTGTPSMPHRQPCAQPAFLLAALVLFSSISCKHTPATQSRPIAKNEHTQPSSTAAQPVAPAPPVRVTAHGPRFAVQVGAFDHRESAEAMASRLSERFGLQTLVAPVESHGATLYRVRLLVGSKDQAESVADTLLRTEKLKVWIVPL